MFGILLNVQQRGLKKKKEAADEEARCALEEYDLSLRQLDDNEEGNVTLKKTSGRKVFGTPGKQAQETNYQNKSDRGNSDSEDDFDNAEHVQSGFEADNVSQEVQVQPDSLHDDPRQKSVFKVMPTVLCHMLFCQFRFWNFYDVLINSFLFLFFLINNGYCRLLMIL